jgi:hypothetical protein
MNFIFIHQLCGKEKEKLVVAYFILLFQHFSGRTERSHKISEVPRQSFKPDIAQLHVRQDAAEQHHGV